MIYEGSVNKEDFANEREILYKILFDMRNEINELKTIVKDVALSIDKPIQVSENFFSVASSSLPESSAITSTLSSGIST